MKTNIGDTISYDTKKDGKYTGTKYTKVNVGDSIKYFNEELAHRNQKVNVGDKISYKLKFDGKYAGLKSGGWQLLSLGRQIEINKRFYSADPIEYYSGPYAFSYTGLVGPIIIDDTTCIWGFVGNPDWTAYYYWGNLYISRDNLKTAQILPAFNPFLHTPPSKLGGYRLLQSMFRISEEELLLVFGSDLNSFPSWTTNVFYSARGPKLYIIYNFVTDTVVSQYIPAMFSQQYPVSSARAALGVEFYASYQSKPVYVGNGVMYAYRNEIHSVPQWGGGLACGDWPYCDVYTDFQKSTDYGVTWTNIDSKSTIGGITTYAPSYANSHAHISITSQDNTNYGYYYDWDNKPIRVSEDTAAMPSPICTNDLYMIIQCAKYEIIGIEKSTGDAYRSQDFGNTWSKYFTVPATIISAITDSGGYDNWYMFNWNVFSSGDVFINTDNALEPLKLYHMEPPYSEATDISEGHYMWRVLEFGDWNCNEQNRSIAYQDANQIHI